MRVSNQNQKLNNLRISITAIGRVLLFAMAVLLFHAAVAPSASAQARDIYITPDGGGSGVCTSNTHPPSWFNNSSNWGSGSAQIGPDTTVHICGTLSGGAGATILSFQGGGTSGHPLTLLFESGAKLTSPVCAGGSGNGCIATNQRAYIVINGDANGGRQGIIENTDNGTNLGRKSPSTGISADRSTGLVVKNLSIRNLYVHTATSDCILGSAGDEMGISALYSDDAVIDNVSVDFAGWALNMGSNNYEVKNSSITNMDHGVADGSHSGPTSGQRIHDNTFGSMAAWDSNSNCYHHDGVHFFSENGVHTGPMIYNNNFSGKMGVNTTAWIFMEGSAGFGQGIHNDLIFNNTFVDTGAYGKNQIWIEGNGQSSGTGVYNNYAYVGNTRNGGAAIFARNVTNYHQKNNIAIGGFTNIQIDGAVQASGGMNNNVYLDAAAQSGNTNGFVFNGNFQSTLSGWKAACSCDANGIMGTTSQIKSDLVTFALSSGSIAIGAGANLSSLGISALNSDKNGVPRPATGAWDAGAVSFGSSAGNTPPAPPTGLTVVVQ